jgi:hypothetical protein
MLLRLLHWQLVDELPVILAHFDACMANWCARTGNAATPAMQRIVVRSVIDELWNSPERVNSKDGAIDIRMRKSSYLALRAGAHSIIHRRLREASRAFLTCLTGTEYRGAGVKWLGTHRDLAVLFSDALQSLPSTPGANDPGVEQQAS